MITDFRVSPKTARPMCCDFDCCGNHFGRISKRYKHKNHTINRMTLTRRYAKHVEKRNWKAEIESELID